MGVLRYCSLFFLVVFVECSPAEKRTIPEKSLDDYPDYLLGVRYDEYPVSQKLNSRTKKLNYIIFNVNRNYLIMTQTRNSIVRKVDAYISK